MKNLKYLYDGYHYTKEELLTYGVTNECINYLKTKKLCKLVENESKYSISFVGVISWQDYVLIFLPKYLDNNPSDEQNINRITLIIKVLKKYAKQKYEKYNDAFYLESTFKDENISEIALADYIIKDYINHGLYIKEEDEYILNGSGLIDWQKTIDFTEPCFSSSGVIYFDTFNKKIGIDPYSEISKIHEWAVIFCIKKYAKILGYDYLGNKYNRNLVDVEKIGTEQNILSIINNELDQVYKDRNILLLKAIHNLILKKFFPKHKQLTLYGTSKFEHVWEKACGIVLGNEYHQLKDYIDRPIWKDQNKNEYPKDHLEPDIIRLFKDNNHKKLIILDPKYYKIEYILNQENKKILVNNPNTEALTKQYMYELLLSKKFKIERCCNALLYPKEIEENYRFIGIVNYPSLDMKSIINIYISPNKVFNWYINGFTLKDDKLLQIFSEVESYRDGFDKK